MSNKNDAVIKSLPAKKTSGPQGFTAEFYETFTKELTQMLLKLFHKTEREGMLPK
jgi:hypothetical protein